MSDRRDGGNRDPRRPEGRGEGSRPGGFGPRSGKPPQGKRPAPKPRGGLRITRIGGNDFDLDHPRCVREMELDYEEGIELWKAGDPESARDALRFALQGCGDNLWVHVALGRIALADFNDPTLARGHFGYAFELAHRALPPNFQGRMPRHHPANRPFYDAIDGLATCYEALDNPGEAGQLRAFAERIAGEPIQPKAPPAPGRTGDGDESEPI